MQARPARSGCSVGETCRRRSVVCKIHFHAQNPNARGQNAHIYGLFAAARSCLARQVARARKFARAHNLRCAATCAGGGTFRRLLQSCRTTGEIEKRPVVTVSGPVVTSSRAGQACGRKGEKRERAAPLCPRAERRGQHTLPVRRKRPPISGGAFAWRRDKRQKRQTANGDAAGNKGITGSWRRGSLFRHPGSTADCAGDRRNERLYRHCAQEPPRVTRRSPESGPRGSSIGDLA